MANMSPGSCQGRLGLRTCLADRAAGFAWRNRSGTAGSVDALSVPSCFACTRLSTVQPDSSHNFAPTRSRPGPCRVVTTGATAVPGPQTCRCLPRARFSDGTCGKRKDPWIRRDERPTANLA
jgi:hypothetical protein